MYSTIKNVQILVKLLKEYKIQHAVVSPGGSSTPIVHSMENDSYFKCYSVVDERSAAYFAMGISQKLHKPVALVCTSGTAVANYLPAVIEARYQNVPLIVITADKNFYNDRQLVTQTIKQDNIFQDKCKHAVSLPGILDSEEDIWYCKRLIHEALLEFDHHGKGPVHINIPIFGSHQDFSFKELPDIKAIKRISYESSSSIWEDKQKELQNFKNILVVFGQNIPYGDKTNIDIDKFAKKYNCVLSVEHTSNVKSEFALNTYSIVETSGGYVAQEMCPDLVITLGGNYASYNMRGYLRSVKAKYNHWVIEESGYVKDPFMRLTDIFECTPEYFFNFFANNGTDNSENDLNFYHRWEKLLSRVKMPELPFSNFYAAQCLAKNIPENSLLHTAILNSTRHTQFFDIPKSVDSYCNLGALGIDGTLSTFFGQAAVTEQLCFLLIGDLSFFYDMNSIRIQSNSKNIRIMLVNNTGAGEFHFYIGKKSIPSINKYISVEHNTTAKAWVESCGFKYISASSKDELDKQIGEFSSNKSEKPILFEVFTDMEKDAELTNELFEINKIQDDASKKMGMIKNVANTLLGEKGTKKAIGIAKILKDKK